MKIFMCAWVWLFVGGLLIGAPAGDAVRECPEARLTSEIYLWAAAWPATIGLAITMGDIPESVRRKGCEQ